MRFRTRLLVMLTGTVVLPVFLLSWLVRENMTLRLQEQHQSGIDAERLSVLDRIRDYSDSAHDRLESLTALINNDNQFRQALLRFDGSIPSIDPYLIEFGERHASLSGLTYFQLQDKNGVVLSSAHFRNEFGRVDKIPLAFRDVVSKLSGEPVVLDARMPDGPALALARIDSVLIAGNPFYLLAGFILDAEFFRGLSPSLNTILCLDIPIKRAVLIPEDSVSCDSAKSALTNPAATRVMDIVFVESSGNTEHMVHFALVQTSEDLEQLLSDLDNWFLAILGIILTLGLISTIWVSGKISEPLSELLYKTTRIDLNRLNISFKTGRSDEIGDLSRVLDELTRRLKRDAASLREVERRLAFGELARQVNHDVKNALAPIRNIVRHFSSLAHDETGELAQVVRDRENSLNESILYLEKLAGNYAKLTPEFRLEATDLNQLIQKIVNDYREATDKHVDLKLASNCIVDIDPVAFRRILDNILDNAFDSLSGGEGIVSIHSKQITDSEAVIEDSGGRINFQDDGIQVRITISDNGKGMNPGEVKNAFKDFYTSKAGGTGLGLSIVRRLVMDLKGSVSLNSSEGSGTHVSIIIPARRPQN